MNGLNGRYHPYNYARSTQNNNGRQTRASSAVSNDNDCKILKEVPSISSLIKNLHDAINNDSSSINNNNRSNGSPPLSERFCSDDPNHLDRYPQKVAITNYVTHKNPMTYNEKQHKEKGVENTPEHYFDQIDFHNYYQRTMSNINLRLIHELQANQLQGSVNNAVIMTRSTRKQSYICVGSNSEKDNFNGFYLMDIEEFKNRLAQNNIRGVSDHSKN